MAREMNAGVPGGVEPGGRTSMEVEAGESMPEAVAGVAAIVLGILTLMGVHTLPFILFSMIVIGSAIVITGTAVTGATLSMIRREAHRTCRRGVRLAAGPCPSSPGYGQAAPRSTSHRVRL